jgi:spore maturation protein CgeB
LTEKEYDIFCSFGHTWTGLRGEVQELCQKLKSEGFNTIIGSGFPYNIYIYNIIQSYISVSSWGAGNSCRRMWEIMSNKTCCFVQKKQILFPNIFEDGVSYVEYSTPEEFEEKARYYLKNKDKCIEIGRNGHLHMKKYHTGKRRLEYMFNVMSGKDWRNAL